MILPPFTAPPSESAAIAAGLRIVTISVYALAQASLVLYTSHRWLMLWRWWRSRPAARDGSPPAESSPEDCPGVTVQLPVYNERLVVERLIDAAAALEWPAGRLEIQVLDDSIDETRDLAAAAVARHRGRGVDIRHLHRAHRAGHKAGALAAGLACARGEWVAVFDADFVPAPDFLRRAARHLGDPRVGMVQARWGHLNRGASLLTAAQAVMLDSHFLLEHEVRMRRRLFFNFNGTAGLWRRACIEDAGGWCHDTLTEDLDLSYRAQLKGWRFAFDATLVAPAELPGDLEALKSQQRRWARGSIQTARKLLPAVCRSRLPFTVKLEAFVHLTSNFCYPLLLALALLLLPVLLAGPRGPAWLTWTVQAGVLVLGVVPVMLFLAAGQWAAGTRGRALPRDVAAALVLGAGLSANNARAVVAGLGRRIGEWERTPKSGEGSLRPQLPGYASARGLAGRTELALALYFAAVAVAAWRAGEPHAIPFMLLMVTGLGAVGAGSLRASLASRRRPA